MEIVAIVIGLFAYVVAIAVVFFLIKLLAKLLIALVGLAGGVWVIATATESESIETTVASAVVAGIVVILIWIPLLHIAETGEKSLAGESGSGKRT